MDFKDILEKLKDNPELARKVSAMWQGGSPVQDVSDALSEAGISVDASQIEGFLAALQSDQAGEISVEDIDESQLKSVAGGTLHNCKMPAAEGMTDCEQISTPNR